jgi:Rieske Fe-S protein
MEINPENYKLKPGTSKLMMYGSIPALLVVDPEGELKTFVALCTHFDCTVMYKADENRIFCACHEGYFDLDGNVLAGPPPAPLREFYKTYKNDQLIIALEKENLEKAFSTS